MRRTSAYTYHIALMNTQASKTATTLNRNTNIVSSCCASSIVPPKRATPNAIVLGRAGTSSRMVTDSSTIRVQFSIDHPRYSAQMAPIKRPHIIQVEVRCLDGSHGANQSYALPVYVRAASRPNSENITENRKAVGRKNTSPNINSSVENQAK